jgi:hypothetical protein
MISGLSLKSNPTLLPPVFVSCNRFNIDLGCYQTCYILFCYAKTYQNIVTSGVCNVDGISENRFNVEALRKSGTVVGERDNVALQQVDHRGQVLLQVDDEVRVKFGESSGSYNRYYDVESNLT